MARRYLVPLFDVLGDVRALLEELMEESVVQQLQGAGGGGGDNSIAGVAGVAASAAAGGEEAHKPLRVDEVKPAFKARCV